MDAVAIEPQPQGLASAAVGRATATRKSWLQLHQVGMRYCINVGSIVGVVSGVVVHSLCRLTFGSRVTDFSNEYENDMQK